MLTIIVIITNQIQPLYQVLILFILRYYFILSMCIVLYSFYCKITSVLAEFIDDNEPSIARLPIPE